MFAFAFFITPELGAAPIGKLETIFKVLRLSLTDARAVLKVISETGAMSLSLELQAVIRAITATNRKTLSWLLKVTEVFMIFNFVRLLLIERYKD
ncbi:hypothetical protein [Larkinella ripae]